MSSADSLNRRRFAGALAAFASASAIRAADTPDRRTRFYIFQAFDLKQGTQSARLTDWFRDTLIPKLEKISPGPKIVLDAVIGSHTPQLVFIAGFPSFAQIGEAHSKLAADSEVAAAFEKLETGPEPAYESQNNTLIEAADFSPEVVAEKRDKPRYFELRVYHSPTERQLQALDERFSGPEIKIFHRSGIHPILYGHTMIGANMPNLTYLIPFDSLDAREKAWDRFAADPDWVKARKESIDKGGQIVSVSQVSIYKAAAYSPVR